VNLDGTTMAEQHLMVSMSPGELEELIARTVRRELHEHRPDAGYVSTDVIARHFEVQRNTITRRWIPAGCPCVRNGQRFRLKIEDVEQWLKEKERPNEAP